MNEKNRIFIDEISASPAKKCFEINKTIIKIIGDTWSSNSLGVVYSSPFR